MCRASKNVNAPWKTIIATTNKRILPAIVRDGVLNVLSQPPCKPSLKQFLEMLYALCLAAPDDNHEIVIYEMSPQSDIWDPVFSMHGPGAMRISYVTQEIGWPGTRITIRGIGAEYP